MNCAVAGHSMALFCRPQKREFYGLHQHHPALKSAARILSIVGWHEKAFPALSGTCPHGNVKPFLHNVQASVAVLSKPCNPHNDEHKQSMSALCCKATCVITLISLENNLF